ncbi:MAG: hypothetical protein ACLGI8_01665 [Acidimicrobiia bacterium]
MTASTLPARAGSALRRTGSVAVELVRSALRDFVVAAVDDGRLRTRGLPTGVRVAVLTAVGLAIGLFVSILAADAWRSTDLVPLTGSGSPLRGTLVPAALVPVTFALLAFAAALCVSGVLRAAPLATAGVVGVYLVVGSFVHGLTVGDDLLHTLAGWALVAVAVLAVAVRRFPLRPTLELVVVLGLVGLTFADAHRLLVSADAASGTGFLPSQTSLLLADVLFLSTPLVVVAALGVLDFGVTAARWGLRFVDLHLGPRTVVAAVVALGVWRVRDLALEISGQVGDHGWAEELRGLTGSVAVAAALVALAAGIRRLAGAGLAQEDPQETVRASAAVALPLTLWLVAASLVLAVLFLVVQGVVPRLPTDQIVPTQERLVDLMEPIGELGASAWWDALRAAGAAAAGAWAARRGRIPVAAFLGGVAIVLLHASLTGPGRALEGWAWTLRGVDLIAIATLVLLVVRWSVGGRLSERRAEWALYLLLLTALLREGDFVADPFAPFLAFAGGAFVLFGLVWGLATGLAWANDGTPGLPRATRAQLLMGYQLLSIAILHWYLVTHDLDNLEVLTEVHPGTGTALLGQPLVLVLLLTGLASALADVEIRSDEEPVEPQVGPEPTASPAGLDRSG